jgi:GNAT superfamily N-acetyltransferase
MAWILTQRLDDFAAAAGDYLRADPVGNTVPLTVLEALHQRGLSAFGDSPPLFGWHESRPRETDCAFLQTPPFPVFIAGLSPQLSNGLVRLLAGRQPAEANLPVSCASEFGAAWSAVTGGSTAITVRMRQFQLGTLAPPEPAPPGTPRTASESDLDLLVGWNDEFTAEAGVEQEDSARVIRDKLGYRGITLWESDGRPVAMASHARQVAGVGRIMSVYTPPAGRGRGYGGAVTTAVSRRLLEQGAESVVLYTNLANPTSNALYQRLGFRPVGDRIVVELR